MEERLRIIEVKDNEKKFIYTGEILKTLPEWFGNKMCWLFCHRNSLSVYGRNM